VFGICKLIDLMVPDIPQSLDFKVKRERYLARQALSDASAVVMVRCHSLAVDFIEIIFVLFILIVFLLFSTLTLMTSNVFLSALLCLILNSFLLQVSFFSCVNQFT